MDLLDFHSRPSRGFHYIYAQDHFNKFHFAAAIVSKSAVDVAKCVQAILMFTGPVKILRCDIGGEFMAGVLALCEQWGMPPPSNSSPYHPQTNGLVERGGGVIKRAIAKWEEQDMTNDWSDVLPRLIYQLNCTAPRTTRRTPYKLVFGVRPRWDSVPISAALDETTLLSVIAEREPQALPNPAQATDAAVATAQAAAESAAALLAGLQLANTAHCVAMDSGRANAAVVGPRTRDAESRTRGAESRTRDASSSPPAASTRQEDAGSLAQAETDVLEASEPVPPVDNDDEG